MAIVSSAALRPARLRDALVTALMIASCGYTASYELAEEGEQVEGSSAGASGESSEDERSAPTAPNGGNGSGPSPCPAPSGFTVIECPEECTGGCPEQGVCMISCAAGYDDDEGCREQDVSCPEGLSCRVLCLGYKSCENAEIACPPEHGCSIECGGYRGCRNARITCAEGGCQLSCNSNNACEEAEVICGRGECLSVCTGKAPKKQECRESCHCVPC